MEKENILFEQNENKQEKMIINTTSDLLKIPLYILNNLVFIIEWKNKIK